MVYRIQSTPTFSTTHHLYRTENCIRTFGMVLSNQSRHQENLPDENHFAN